MNIDRFKHQHVDILDGIAGLRRLVHQGIAPHAPEIARQLEALARVVTQHLAVEDRILYPSLARSGNSAMADMSRQYQTDMDGIATAFINFARRWADARILGNSPEVFRAEANVVLKNVHDRMVRENREFYPAIEAMG